MKRRRRDIFRPLVSIDDVDVHLVAMFEGRTILAVSTKHKEIEIYVSLAGRSIRVWRDGEELT